MTDLEACDIDGGAPVRVWHARAELETSQGGRRGEHYRPPPLCDRGNPLRRATHFAREHRNRKQKTKQGELTWYLFLVHTLFIAPFCTLQLDLQCNAPRFGMWSTGI